MIIFVGDKPSKKNVSTDIPFVGTLSYKNLLNWIYEMDVDVNFVKTRNKDFAPNLAALLKWYPHPIKIVALGEAASKELGKFEIPHFTLPHPSPRNRKLNDKKFLKMALDSCKVYLGSKRDETR